MKDKRKLTDRQMKELMITMKEAGVMKSNKMIKCVHHCKGCTYPDKPCGIYQPEPTEFKGLDTIKPTEHKTINTTTNTFKKNKETPLPPAVSPPGGNIIPPFSPESPESQYKSDMYNSAHIIFSKDKAAAKEYLDRISTPLDDGIDFWYRKWKGKDMPDKKKRIATQGVNIEPPAIEWPEWEPHRTVRTTLPMGGKFDEILPYIDKDLLDES